MVLTQPNIFGHKNTCTLTCTMPAIVGGTQHRSLQFRQHSQCFAIEGQRLLTPNSKPFHHPAEATFQSDLPVACLESCHLSAHTAATAATGVTIEVQSFDAIRNRALQPIKPKPCSVHRRQLASCSWQLAASHRGAPRDVTPQWGLLVGQTQSL